MSTDQSTSLTQAELLHNYLGFRLSNGGRDATIEQLMTEFAEYRRELDEFRETLREAEAQSARGESKPLDLEALFARVDKRLDERGIPE
jgi:hypothetical protein